MTTLLIAEHDNKILADANKKAMDAATKIGEEIHILVAVSYTHLTLPTTPYV